MPSTAMTVRLIVLSSFLIPSLAGAQALVDLEGQYHAIRETVQQQARRREMQGRINKALANQGVRREDVTALAKVRDTKPMAGHGTILIYAAETKDAVCEIRVGDVWSALSGGAVEPFETADCSPKRRSPKE